MGILGNCKIAFGGASVSGEGGGYGFGEISHQASDDLIWYAFERGILVFDTAPCYGYHQSEIRIGRALKPVREKVIIVSKSGVTWHSNKRMDMTNDPAVTKKMLEDSLRSLDTDYIDIYMIHWPDKNVDIRKPMEVLSKAKLEGKIKHIGLCNTTVDDITLAGEIDKIEVVQSEFNIFNHQAREKLFPFLSKSSIEFMSWGTFDKGVLTGNAKKGRVYDKFDLRSWAPWWKKSNLDEKYEMVEQLKTVAKNQNVSLLDLALGFNLNHKDLSVAICGAKNIKQLDEILNSVKSLSSKENKDAWQFKLESINNLFKGKI